MLLDGGVERGREDLVGLCAVRVAAAVRGEWWWSCELEVVVVVVVGEAAAVVTWRQRKASARNVSWSPSKAACAFSLLLPSTLIAPPVRRSEAVPPRVTARVDRPVSPTRATSTKVCSPGTAPASGAPARAGEIEISRTKCPNSSLYCTAGPPDVPPSPGTTCVVAATAPAALSPRTADGSSEGTAP